MEGDRYSTVLNVRFPPAWEQIEPLRQYVVVCAAGAGEQIANRIAIVLQELLENAVKYGDALGMIELQVTISSLRKTAEIRVSNRAQPSRIALLKKEIDAIGSGGHAKEAFARALQRAQRLPQGSTMLGLPRIAMESALSLEIAADQVVMLARVG